MGDHDNPRETFLYKLSKARGLESFQHIAFASCFEDARHLPACGSRWRLGPSGCTAEGHACTLCRSISVRSKPTSAAQVGERAGELAGELAGERARARQAGGARVAGRNGWAGAWVCGPAARAHAGAGGACGRTGDTDPPSMQRVHPPVMMRDNSGEALAWPLHRAGR